MGFPTQVIKEFEGWMYDDDGWNRFSRDYLGVKLDREQDEALYTIRHNPKTAIASGTSRGKDFVVADAAVCFLYLTPEFDEEGKMVSNTKVVLTAPTGRQVKDIMRPEVARIFKNAPYLPGWLTGNDIRTPYPEWFLTGFKADDHNTEAWTGIHAANVFIGVTEATGLPQLVFDAIEGNLQGNSRLVIVFNPNINHGYAASAMKSPQFKKIRLNSLNAPNVIAKKIIHPGQVDYQWIIGAFPFRKKTRASLKGILNGKVDGTGLMTCFARRSLACSPKFLKAYSCHLNGLSSPISAGSLTRHITYRQGKELQELFVKYFSKQSLSAWESM